MIEREVQIGPHRLILADCREVTGLQVDAVITDPPYQQTALPWDRWPEGWVDAVDRALKPTGSLWVFGTLRMFLHRRDDFAAWRLAQDIIWEKHNGSSIHADRFRRVHEQAAQFYRGDWAAVHKGRVVTMGAQRRSVRRHTTPAHLNGMGSAEYGTEAGGPLLMRSVMFVRSEHGRAEHPTQKPEGIVAPLIENACPPLGHGLGPVHGQRDHHAVCAPPRAGRDRHREQPCVFRDRVPAPAPGDAAGRPVPARGAR